MQLPEGTVVRVHSLNNQSLERPHHGVVVFDPQLRVSENPRSEAWSIAAWIIDPDGREFQDMHVNRAGRGWYFARKEFVVIPEGEVPDELWARYVKARLLDAC